MLTGMTGEQLPGAAAATHITEALRHAGVPGSTRVREVAVESDRPPSCHESFDCGWATRVIVTAAPNSLILKTGLPERIGSGLQAGLQEVEFYSKVAAAMDPRLVPRCFEATGMRRPISGICCWRTSPTPMSSPPSGHCPPRRSSAKASCETCARFHAAWWDDPRLGGSIGTWRDAAARDRMLQDLTAHFARFADRLGDCLPRERRMLYERFLGSAPRLLEHATTRVAMSR